MRVLLAQNSLYYPAHGGGDKSNRLLMEALARRGHECRAVARLSTFGPPEHDRYLGELAARSVQPEFPVQGIVAFSRNGVGVRVATNANWNAFFGGQVDEFAPEVILASTDDPAQSLLERALRSPARVAYLVRATLPLPFGPDCAFPSAAKAAALGRADAVVGVSEYAAAYVRRHGGIGAVHVPISLLEPEDWPELGRFDNEFVTMVNPCAVKGIALLLALADQMPDVAFAAVPSWGTNRRDRAALELRPNIQVLPLVDDINQLLGHARVLLVPSLWAEARSRIVLEAMLRGVPVMASDTGGLPEAKMGVPYVLPVNPVACYHPRVDEQMVPVAEVPPQAAGPWSEALRELLTSRRRYAEIAFASRQAALHYAAGLNVLPFERLLQETIRRPKGAPAGPRATSPETLSPEKRKLLALRLRQKAGSAVWFPGTATAVVGSDALYRLFCFPHAGGGAAAFADWNNRLGSGCAVCPLRLPGRESRVAEAPFERMGPLVHALNEAIRPYLDRPFAFFGHSMGAAVAFELARQLRRRGLRGPRALFVSGARAPRFRRGWIAPPDPDEPQFLAELRRREGIPLEALDNPDLMRLLMAPLRADTALYRKYVYTDEAPLDCNIRAYGGDADPEVRREDLEAWGGETTASFALHMLPGGHFFLFSNREAFFAALTRDLEELC
jgi:surfactin synthase thioesterase subunit/glycosyltransferase involved in cell wall biosynthesis